MFILEQKLGWGALSIDPPVREFPSLTRRGDWRRVGARFTPMELTDEEGVAAALRQLREGNRAALGDLYEAYGKLVYSVAYKILKNGADAEEATQDAFVGLWRASDSLNDNAARVLPWLLRTVRHRCIDRIRRAERRVPDTQKVDGEANPGQEAAMADRTTALDSAIRAERAEGVKRALAELPSEQREVVELAYFKGLSQSEIAAKLDEPLGTIKSRMRYALNRLRREWEGSHVS